MPFRFTGSIMYSPIECVLKNRTFIHKQYLENDGWAPVVIDDMTTNYRVIRHLSDYYICEHVNGVWENIQTL